MGGRAIRMLLFAAAWGSGVMCCAMPGYAAPVMWTFEELTFEGVPGPTTVKGFIFFDASKVSPPGLCNP
jgi:hypothetical protein